jgi:hypothetical protein
LANPVPAILEKLGSAALNLLSKSAHIRVGSCLLY